MIPLLYVSNLMNSVECYSVTPVCFIQYFLNSNSMYKDSEPDLRRVIVSVLRGQDAIAGQHPAVRSGV